MMSPETTAEILRLYHAEKWRIGTIAHQLGLHHSAVRRVLSRAGVPAPGLVRPSQIDPFLPFILETLGKFPRLPASRLYEMCRSRGYRGSQSQFRHRISLVRPRLPAEAFLRLRTLPGEQAQVDWGHFGRIVIGRAQRQLMAFVMVLSFSRAIFLRFFLGACTENFLRGHELAFADWGGVPRKVLYDNLKSAVLERQGDAIRFNPKILEFAGAYRFLPRPVARARGNEKGRVERAISYIRTSFFLARQWRDLDDLNLQAHEWCHGLARERPWQEDDRRTVQAAFEEEQPRLLELPPAPVPIMEHLEASVGKTPYVRFDGNDYSLPHEHVRRTVLVIATLEEVRIVVDGAVVARHRRSYDRRQQIEDHAHILRLQELKTNARQHRGLDRLSAAVPSARRLLEHLALAGSRLGAATKIMLQLLDVYGPAAVEKATQEALAHGTAHPHAVRQLLERDAHLAGTPPPVAIRLPDDPRVRDLIVRPHALSDYDQISNHNNTEDTHDEDSHRCAQ